MACWYNTDTNGIFQCSFIPRKDLFKCVLDVCVFFFLNTKWNWSILFVRSESEVLALQTVKIRKLAHACFVFFLLVCRDAIRWSIPNVWRWRWYHGNGVSWYSVLKRFLCEYKTTNSMWHGVSIVCFANTFWSFLFDTNFSSVFWDACKWRKWRTASFGLCNRLNK